MLKVKVPYLANTKLAKPVQWLLLSHIQLWYDPVLRTTLPKTTCVLFIVLVVAVSMVTVAVQCSLLLLPCWLLRAHTRHFTNSHYRDENETNCNYNYTSHSFKIKKACLENTVGLNEGDDEVTCKLLKAHLFILPNSLLWQFWLCEILDIKVKCIVGI